MKYARSHWGEIRLSEDVNDDVTYMLKSMLVAFAICKLIAVRRTAGKVQEGLPYEQVAEPVLNLFGRIGAIFFFLCTISTPICFSFVSFPLFLSLSYPTVSFPRPLSAGTKSHRKTRRWKHLQYHGGGMYRQPCGKIQALQRAI